MTTLTFTASDAITKTLSVINARIPDYTNSIKIAAESGETSVNIPAPTSSTLFLRQEIRKAYKALGYEIDYYTRNKEFEISWKLAKPNLKRKASEELKQSDDKKVRIEDEDLPDDVKEFNNLPVCKQVEMLNERIKELNDSPAQLNDDDEYRLESYTRERDALLEKPACECIECKAKKNATI